MPNHHFLLGWPRKLQPLRDLKYSTQRGEATVQSALHGKRLFKSRYYSRQETRTVLSSERKTRWDCLDGNIWTLGLFFLERFAMSRCWFNLPTSPGWLKVSALWGACFIDWQAGGHNKALTLIVWAESTLVNIADLQGWFCPSESSRWCQRFSYFCGENYTKLWRWSQQTCLLRWQTGLYDLSVSFC